MITELCKPKGHTQATGIEELGPNEEEEEEEEWYFDQEVPVEDKVRSPLVEISTRAIFANLATTPLLHERRCLDDVTENTIT